METRISIIGGDQSDLESLGDWLRQERGLSGRIKVAAASPREGELGSLGEALVVAVGSGGTLSVLAASLKAWMTLPRRSDVKIRIEGSDGRVVDIDATRVDVAHVESLVRLALAPREPEE
jgi:Effector Associated Constant Component 1